MFINALQQIFRMVLDSKTVDQIKAFVYQKPRTIDEIARMLKKNWRTADRYVREIVERTGTIGVRTFREGTRGALKIVYWENLEKIYSTKVQEQIFKRLEIGINKTDFSPFDIYQYIHEENRSAEVNKPWDIPKILNNAKQEVLVFSGNLTFLNNKILRVMEKLADNGCYIKVLCRIDIVSAKNVERILSINDRIKKELIEVRHLEQPLRAFVIDSNISYFREIRIPSIRDEELKTPMEIYYEINDKDWSEWLKNLFFKKFQSAIPAQKRLEDVETIKML